MKKAVVLLMVISLLLSGCRNSYVEETNEDTFAILEGQVSSEINENDYWKLYARYSDTKEPITLSMYYNGKIYATVPIENKEREIEAFLPEKIKFADYKASKSEFNNINTLAETGVITGDENGKANPFMAVTRGEAVAMLMRSLGLKPENDLELEFTDVSPNEWYYGYIASAYKRKIVSGDSKTEFLPENNI